MTDGLKDVHRKAIIAVIAANDRVERAVLFGSRATGTNTVSSDVDIALFGDRLTLTDQAHLAAALDELPMAQSVDLLLYDSIQGPMLREHIRLQGVEWYARRPTETHDAASETSSEWPVVTVEDLSEKVAMGPFGSSIKVSTFVPAGVPIISGQHLHGVRVDDSLDFNFISHEHADRLANANVRRGDVIFTHAGNIGQVAYIPESSRFDRYVISQRQFYLRCAVSKAIPSFVALYFTSAGGQHQLLANASQVGVPSIAQPVSYLRTLDIALPPLSEQRTIARVLGTLDDKIKLNRRMNATLEAMARALFRSWFVDFDPVRAKIEGRDTGLPKEIADLFPDRLVDSELGEIPEGWKFATVGDHVVNFDAKRIPVSRAVRAERKGPYPYHGAAGVLDHVDDYIFDGVFLLLGEDGSVMHENGLAVTQYVWGKFWVNNHAHVLQGVAPVSTEQAYLHFAFEPVAPLVTGAVQPKLSQSRMNRVPFVFAGDCISRAFAGIVQPWFARLRSRADQTRILVALRDALLPKLISGELRVTGLEAPSVRHDGPVSVGTFQA